MRKVLLVLSILVFVVCGCYLFVVLRPDNSIPTPKTVATISTSSVINAQTESISELTVYEKYHELYEQNNDLVGWITIDGTRINYPIMQCKTDNEFYLRRNFKKEQNRNGLPFADNRCDLSNPNTNILIYGHNMINGTMFSDLLKYDKASFCKKYPIIKYDTLDESKEYQIFAAFYTRIDAESKDAFLYYQYVKLNMQQTFDQYVDKVKQLSLYKTDVSVAFGDEILTLSTCGGEKDVGRFVVVAKRIV